MSFCFYSKDFGAEVRLLFQTVSSNELSDHKISNFLAEKVGLIDCLSSRFEETYDFLWEQTRLIKG